MSFPFDRNIKAETIAENLSTIFYMDNITLEAEIITLPNDIYIKARASEDSLEIFSRR